MPDRDEDTGRFEATVDPDDFVDELFASNEPRSTREVADRLDISRSRTYELLRDLEEESAIASKKFDELGGVVWFRE